MSILNVNQIQPVGSGQTVTISATNISAGSATVTAGTFSGNLSSSGISTFSDTVNVGAGKSIRLYGATSGYSEIVAAAGSASTTFTLPANGGSASQYLQTDGSGVLSWATPAAGKILQVVSTSSSTNTTNSTSTYATLLSQTITLSSTSNYVLAFASISLRVNPNTNAYGDVAIYHTDTSGTQVVQVFNGQNENVSSDYNFTCLGRHAPSSTDEQTYVLAFRRGSSATTSVSTDSRLHQLILVEVAG